MSANLPFIKSQIDAALPKCARVLSVDRSVVERCLIVNVIIRDIHGGEHHACECRVDTRKLIPADGVRLATDRLVKTVLVRALLAHGARVAPVGFIDIHDTIWRCRVNGESMDFDLQSITAGNVDEVARDAIRHVNNLATKVRGSHD